MRYWLKPCPHCRNGLLIEDRDSSGRYVQCPACGYRLIEVEWRFLVASMVEPFPETPAPEEATV